jgi:hypothetical protein
MAERIAFAMDFLTPRAAICFCRSDLALAGPELDFAVSHSMKTTQAQGMQSLTEIARLRPTWPYLERHCRRLLSTQPEKEHVGDITNHGFWSSAHLRVNIRQALLGESTYICQPKHTHFLGSRVFPDQRDL